MVATMTTENLKPIIEALRALGITKGAGVRLIAKRGITIVYINDRRFGVWDHAKKTFVD